MNATSLDCPICRRELVTFQFKLPGSTLPVHTRPRCPHCERETCMVFAMWEQDEQELRAVTVPLEPLPPQHYQCIRPGCINGADILHGYCAEHRRPGFPWARTLLIAACVLAAGVLIAVAVHL